MILFTILLITLLILLVATVIGIGSVSYTHLPFYRLCRNKKRARKREKSTGIPVKY